MKIGLIGEMATGKTELAKYFMTKYTGQKVSFADALKEEVSKFGLTPDGEVKKPRDRKVLQSYGQIRRGDLQSFDANGHHVEILNNILHIDGETTGKICYANAWTDIAMNKVALFEHEGANVIFDDIRFENEVKLLMENQFLLIRIFATEDIRKQRLTSRDGGFDPEDFKDISETTIKCLPINYMIDNSGTLEESTQTLDCILDRAFVKTLKII